MLKSSVLTELGFSPSRALHAGYVEYSKDYGVSETEVVRVRVQFEKAVAAPAGVSGGGGSLLASVIVTTQATYAPDRAEDATWREGVPEIARDDIERLVTELRTVFDREAASIVVKKCVQCENESPDFYIVNGDIVCQECVNQRQRRNLSPPAKQP